MIWLILGWLLTFAIGAGLNYIGVATLIEAFAFSGGDAIGAFLCGCFIVLIGCAVYMLHALIWYAAIQEIKEKLK